MNARRDRALAGARALLAAPSTVAKWVGIEALGAMKATEDAPRIAALASSRERLGRLLGGSAAEGRPDPYPGPAWPRRFRPD